jgi:hypothetical protein
MQSTETTWIGASPPLGFPTRLQPDIQVDMMDLMDMVDMKKIMDLMDIRMWRNEAE